MAKFSKFVRPQTPSRGTISQRDLEIVEAVLRYRFSPTSEIHPQMEDELRQNREANYAGAAVKGQHMKLGFLQHALTISRMHFMLEISERMSGGKIELTSWRQGAELRGHKVEVPEIRSRRTEGSNRYEWEEYDGAERLPVEPDAIFTLRFTDRPADQQLAHFFYEADRGTMPPADMLKKLRAYHHFIKRQQRHREAFGVHPIRRCPNRDYGGAKSSQAHAIGHAPGSCETE